ncbi:helicase C-terminal domain-containing protein [Treponema zioleckii]|uniref:helicase C-terminal domain-containing protein n=1 Tax=Treponema zioleckii TaxID=331680 RepID=UPI00168A7DCB|nr:helicase C-terminal domain-containing protein [Treponema zioleckii]
MGVTSRFSADTRNFMRQQIVESGGNEVFFVGNIDSKGVIMTVSVAARGNQYSVPVNFSQAREGSVLIHNHPSGFLYPSDADLAIASDCSENAQGFYIINNDVSDVYVVMEPILPKVVERLEGTEVSAYLSKNGALSKIYDNYEERPSQIQLVEKITESFNKNGIGVFEAGTGVGKSFAYLIPSMLWALKNKERIVISTGTINLQQQLSEKDIPLAEKIVGKKIKSILIKGRQNYVCLRRLGEVSAERDLFDDETEILDKINEWVKNTENGSKSDLSFMPPEGLWQRINSEADACMGMRCQFREKCFVMRVRKEALDSSILIVNHHMLFADIESRMNGAGYDETAVLPPYRRIVFDEAHGIENAATSFFSNGLNRFKLFKQLNLLYRHRKGSASGFLFTLCALSRGEDKSATVEDEIGKVRITMQNLENAVGEVMKNEFAIRLYEKNSQMFTSILDLLSELQKRVAKITGLVREIIDMIDDDDCDNSCVWESKSVLRRLDDMTAVCQNFNAWDEHLDQVFWIQKSRLSATLAKDSENPFFFQFVQTPLDIAPMMNSGVYEPMNSVVCTSATLGISGKFNFWENRTGVKFVEQERVLRGVFDSPFNYEKNMVFAVPSDAPFPDNENFQAFVENAIAKLIENAGGKTLVLFTSYESLRHACDTVKTLLRNSGITILKQGDDDRFRLLSLFKTETSSVLFATDSFWEGVDVPGESLSQLVIVKLPFGVPSDPVFAARSELIQKKGGSPFMELSVPEAVIKFRQGFGRLIRRGDDHGAVVVMDRRIIEKRYGELFLRSVPKTLRLYEPFEKILPELKKYY